MNIWEFLAERNWLVAGVFLLIIAGTLCSLAHTIFKIINRFFRSRNIRLSGWPPNYLDADGDWKSVQKIEPAKNDD